ncbi:hypothetical protein [Bacillus massilinigeriensis]|uniref:hypothetical protein n=1 Tax=Bacillus mediterraneensis TaxID=1805474 RepID=UPI0008F9399C|nr:hypothetical protein [Bacillus mediterraneensis]
MRHDPAVIAVVETIMEISGTKANIVLEDYFPGDRFAGGKYQPASHTITIYIEEIREQCNQIFKTDVCFEEYLSIVLAHEIGHAEDAELMSLVDLMDNTENEIDRSRILLQIEQNAWDYATSIIPERSSFLLSTVISHSLQPHYEAIKRSGNPQRVGA